MSMDGFGLALAGVAARATVLGLAGIGVYAWARRRGPSSAATAALAGLLALAGVAALGLAPWPRLWTLDSGMSRELTTVSAADPASKDAPSSDAADSGRAGARDPLRSESPASSGPAGLAHVRPGAKTPTWPAGPWSTGVTRPGAAPRPGGRAPVLDRIAGWFGRPSPTPLPAQPVSEAIPAGIPAATTSADAIVSGGPEVVFAGASDTPLSGPVAVVPEAPAPPPTRGGLMGRLERMLVGLGQGRREPGARPVTSFPSGLGGHAGPPSAPRREEPSESRAAPEVAATAAPPTAPGGGSDWRGRIEGSLALAFAAGVGLALVRLVAGLWAVERLKGRSRPVEDGAIRAMAAELAGAMGLGRPVELRASAFVATPATVGWRRPVVVLPVDWPAWSADERRAVLAHELAHIVRRDYPAWVAAQLSLALHFYHPLAHWLAGRLRLQQELAADATAARHAGGRRAYLAALARMALRQDRGNFVGSAALGPARPFFPRWGTLVRRIEMLRRTEESRRPSSPLATRFVTYGLLVGLGVVLAGLRPPEGRAGGPRAQDPADAGAKAKPERQDRPAPDAPGTLSLDYVPDDAALVVAARPSAILARPEIRALLDAVRGEEGVAQVLAVADPGSIEQITVVLGRSAVGLLAAGGDDPSALMLAGGVIVRTKSPRDWKSAAGAFLPGITEARHAGQPYHLVPVEEGLSVGFFQPDERTLVVAPVPTLFGFLRPSRGDAGHRWSDAWREVASGEVAVAADVGSLVGPLLPMLSQSEEFAMIGGPVAPLWEETESLAIGLDLSQGFGLRVVASCGSDEGARRVERTLQAVLTLGENASKQVFPMLRRAALGGDGEAAALLTLVDLGEQLLDGAEAERDGLIVRLSLDSKVDLGALVRLVLATL
jgi:beta-lactamase regulating signal transducer with metallopeptidase domain